METELFINSIGSSADILKNGGLVGVPTETVYGLAANGLNEKAVEKLYEVKGRPAVKPISLMVPGAEAIEKYCSNVPAEAKLLADAFWPGPLTIVLEAKEAVPSIVRAGGRTVGLRCPDCELTLKLLKEAALPLAVPSANPSGEPSPKNAEKVMEYFSGRIKAVIDGGECTLGLESTIIDMSARPFRILRRGALSAEAIADVLLKNIPVIGITGQTGCGKSSALETLKDKGALILDCDKVYHEMLNSDEAMINEIRENFPDAFEGAELNRKKLGSIVFNDPELLNKLNSITHRYIKTEVKRRLREFALAGGSIAAVDAIELISSGIADECSFTVAVLADREKRIERIMQRDGISREYAEARVNSQHGEEYFKEKCTRYIYNNSTVDDFRKRFIELTDEEIKHGRD